MRWRACSTTTPATCCAHPSEPAPVNAAIAAADWLLAPVHLSMSLAALAIAIWLLHWRRSGVALLSIALGWSLPWSLPAASDGLRASLSLRHRALAPQHLPAADAIVVLGGDIGAVRRYDLGDPDDPRLAGNGLALAAQAWRAQRAPHLLLSGGPSASTGGVSEARIMADALRKLGVPAQALQLEAESRSTAQNAAYSARIARDRQWRSIVLVTSSMHMPRALALFEREGLRVYALPAADAGSLGAHGRRWRPSLEALGRSRDALKEYAGLLAIACCEG